MEFKITALMEDRNPHNGSLSCQHGLSFLITTAESKILFDCGADEKFIENARKINADISSVDCVLLSHAHYDHCGGFSDYVEEFKPKRLIVGKGFFNEKYGSTDGVRFTYLGAGFDEDYLNKRGVKCKFCSDELKIDNSCYLITNFKRSHRFETIPKRFVLSCENTPDMFDDEIAAVVKTSKGLVVIVGCSHPGILNILDRINEFFDESIYAVFGGTHLLNADEERIKITLEEIKKMGVKILGLSHCSGDEVIDEVKMDKDFISCSLQAGDSFVI